MPFRALALAAVSVALAWPVAPARAQQPSPSDTVRAFYTLLREHRYAEGFACSVYADAIRGLAETDLAELAPEFQATFSDIPSDIKIGGEQISGQAATVFADFGTGEMQQVALVKEGGRWLVGDRETLEQVQREKASFFFNARINVNHNAVFKLLKQIVGAQDVHFGQKKAYGTTDELIAIQGLTSELKGGAPVSGYTITVNLAPDRSAYSVTAVPVRFGRTGKLSFYADTGGIRAAESRGLAVSDDAPVLVDSALAPVGESPTP
jgi:hypothetical protein